MEQQGYRKKEGERGREENEKEEQEREGQTDQHRDELVWSKSCKRLLIAHQEHLL